MPIRTLPVFKAFRHMLNGVAAHWRPAFRIAAPWLFLITVFTIWNVKSHPFEANSPFSTTVSWSDGLTIVINLVALSSFAVSWHKFILRDEPLEKVIPFRVDRWVLNYIARNLLIYLVCLVPFVVLITGLVIAADLLKPLLIALLIQLAIFGYRMSLSLPASAIGDTTTGLKRSLEITKGNNLRILGLLALTYLVLAAALLALFIVATLFEALQPNLAIISTFVLGIPVIFIQMILTSTMFTSLYGFFVEQRDF